MGVFPLIQTFPSGFYTIAHSDTYWHFEQGWLAGCSLEQVMPGINQENPEESKRGHGDIYYHPRHGSGLDFEPWLPALSWDIELGPAAEPPATELFVGSLLCAKQKSKCHHGDVPPFHRLWGLLKVHPSWQVFLISGSLFSLGSGTLLCRIHFRACMLSNIQLRSQGYIWVWL